MTVQRPDLAALAFCGLVVVAVTVCAVLGVNIPDFLPAVGMFVAGGGVGVAVMHRPAPASFPELTPAPDVAAAAVPAPRYEVGLPTHLLDEPAPYATHAP